jgi:hypothetical protein
MIRFVSGGWVLLVLCFGALAEALSAPAAPVRLAVVSSADAADLAALVTTELAAKPGLVLLERDDLAAIGDEKKLQDLAGSDPAALGKLLHADGLLFLTRDTAGCRARLTAVGLGFVLADWDIPPSLDPWGAARSLADHVAALAPKLLLPPGKAVPIALLNFRVDESFVDSADLERAVTLLLESRLTAVPEDIVLERRHADALGFEQDLAGPGAAGLLPGTYLVDGSIHLALAPSRDITLSFRVRSPAGTLARSVEVIGSRDDLPKVVDELAGRITAAVGAPVSGADWQPKAEAREFLSEGIWGWQHHDLPAALEALDSAEMLGETAGDLQVIRARVLLELASQEPTFYGGKDITPAPMPMRERIDLLHRALADAAAYRAEKGETKLVFFSTNRNIEVRSGDLRGALNKAEFHILQDLEKSSDAALAESLRHELRERLGYNPAAGRFPDVDDPDALADSVQEEAAYYLGNAADPRRHWYPYHLNSDSFAKRFLPNDDARMAAYRHCVDAMAAKPATRLYGLMLKSDDPDTATREQAYQDLIDGLWNERTTLVAEDRFYNACSRASTIRDDVRIKYAQRTIPLLHFFLAQAGQLKDENEYYAFKYLWQPKYFTPEEARSLWPEFLAARARLIAQAAPDRQNNVRAEVDTVAGDFRQAWPDLGAEKETKVRWLSVDTYWTPHPDADRRNLRNFAWLDDGHDFVWVLGDGGSPEAVGLYHVHLPDLATTFIPTECGPRPYDVAQTSQALWVTYGDYPATGGPIQIFLKRYDLAAKTWQTRRIVDITEGGLYAIGGQIYFNLWTVDHSHEEGGVARYDWASDKLTVLASSRRRPAQNQFDDRAGYQLRDIFQGPEGRVCVNADGGVYEVKDTPGTWPAVAGMTGDTECVTFGEQTLARTFGGEVTLLDPAKPKAIQLMTPVVPTDWRPGPDGKMIQRLPDWSSQALWKKPSNWAWTNVLGNPHYLGYHDGHFFALRGPTAEENYFELLWFTPGQPEPRAIPIKLLIHGSEQDALNGFVFPPTAGSTNSLLTMLVSPAGICLHEMCGFWFVSYDEIERYLNGQAG